ncbi:MAG: PEP/pyruvate-binding domain-containing protein [Desulfococcaceae bacterium]|jgi:pyruvate,water dikinase|nr:PEP/pyruvate-binding domain-containing protein [Desulfococcaceae bacterium]
MKRILNAIKKRFIYQIPQHTEEETEQLRLDFRKRYHHFRLLLSANQKALEIMADIEQAMCNRPFGMSFVRSACTGVAVNVLGMIRSMDRLAPGKYPELRTRFENIHRNIQEVLAPKSSHRDSSLILHLEELDRSKTDLAGGKMSSLGEIRNQLSVRIPEGFVITTHAYDRFLSDTGLQDEINSRIQTADTDDLTGLFSLSAGIQQLLLKTPVPEDVAEAIYAAWRKLEKTVGTEKLTVALRSSSLFEDSAGASFAGQFRTELNVSYDSLLTAYREVVASKYSVQAITYRMNKGFRDEDIAIAVGCVAMVDAVAGGVAYSSNPVDAQDDSVHISSAWGLPKSIVDGSAACDHFIVERKGENPSVRSEIGRKETKFICYPEEGVCRIELMGDKSTMPSLTGEQISALRDIVLRLEDFYKKPVDTEWAVAGDGGIVILQCRPMKHGEIRQKRGEPPAADVPVILEGGVTASPGACAGEVFIAAKSVDALKFPRDGILVIRQALPQWAGLISRASGIVAEQGGVAGHLANVAREFSVPALFDCRDALEKLTPGMTVTLDADYRKIYPGRIEELLLREDACENPMTGSPVYEILANAGRHIIPLTLLDPSSTEFRPANCKTLHDLTRFIHEKSVHDMFSFGSEHSFSELSGKQLHYKVPMQWWILNLDDGFSEEVKGKYVRLEQICSVPMRAFWEGFVAIPWDGPPAMDRRGFASVLFQSTVNPALNTGVRSQFAEKNYFMISRNFCNLNSRLGYHFAVMEALVSERIPENYVSFRFKGGAADQQRRLRRVRFIGEILEDYDFHIEIREDCLIARLQNFDSETMCKRIRILGHLSLHTRQLDMIMNNPSQVRYFGNKIRDDIEKLLSEPAKPQPS